MATVDKYTRAEGDYTRSFLTLLNAHDFQDVGREEPDRGIDRVVRAGVSDGQGGLSQEGGDVFFQLKPATKRAGAFIARKVRRTSLKTLASCPGLAYVVGFDSSSNTFLARSAHVALVEAGAATAKFIDVKLTERVDADWLRVLHAKARNLAPAVSTLAGFVDRGSPAQGLPEVIAGLSPTIPLLPKAIASHLRELERAARAAFRRRDYARARKTLTELLTIGGSDGIPHDRLWRIRNLRGACLVGLEDLGEAAVEFEEAAALEPDKPSPRANIILVRVEQHDVAAARAALAATPGPLRGTAELRNAQGMLEREEGSIEAATVSFRRASRAKPAWVAPHRNLAHLQMDQGDERAALRTLQKGGKVCKPPRDAGWIHADIGQLLLDDAVRQAGGTRVEKGESRVEYNFVTTEGNELRIPKADAAAESLATAARLIPGGWRAVGRNYLLACMLGDRPKRALPIARSLLGFAETRPDALRALAQIHARLGDFEAAERIAAEALAEVGDDLNLLCLRAHALRHLDRRPEALDAYRRAASVGNATDTDIRHFVSYATLIGDLDAAVTFLRGLIDERGPTANWTRWLGQLARGLADAQLERRAIEGYVACGAADTPAKLRLAYLRAILGDLAGSVGAFQLLSLDEHEFATALTCGGLLCHLERWEDALPFARRAMRLADGQSQIVRANQLRTCINEHVRPSISLGTLVLPGASLVASPINFGFPAYEG